MKIVIDVPEKVYNHFCRCCRFPDEVEEAIIAITDGTPLPEGHGRLIDADELKILIPAIETEYKYVHRLIDEAPTIIDAEGSGE